VSEVVEAVARLTETSAIERRPPDSLAEVGRLKRSSEHRAEDQLGGRVPATFDRTSRELTQADVNGWKQRYGPDAGIGLRTLQDLARVGALHADK